MPNKQHNIYFYRLSLGLLLLAHVTAAQAPDSPAEAPQSEPASSPAATPQSAEPAQELTANQMINAIVQKNMFRPGRELPPEPVISTQVGVTEPRLKRLTRPFKLSAIDEIGGQPRAHLFFGNIRRTVTVGEDIEFIRVKHINVRPPYIVCDYGPEEVRIDVGETSDDAMLRLVGFGNLYEFIGTQITDEKAYATVYIDGKYHRVEAGEKLGNATIVRIENGKMWLRFEDGFEFDLEPSSKKIMP